nr:protein phosphatase Slingshot homolog 2 [Zootoca vivipara]
MALVTVQRSPTPSATSSPCASEADSGEDDCRFQPRSISESFLTVKGAALFLPRGNGSSTPRISHRRNKHAGDLQQHLQAMFMLLRPEDNIRLAVRLESTYQNRTRYMVVVSTNGRQDTEENIVLGMDFSCNDSSVCTMGLVLPLWSDALIHLDGDGGFSVSTDNRVHIFKPVSVQAMWSALQSLHKACEVARINNYYPGSLFLTWVSYYESHINSDQSSVNEWNAMKDVQSHRPDSPALFTDVPTERERTERLIKTKLREIMMQKDLENITSKEIRTELEMQMACNLREFKEFIDNEMIVILGQMDSPTQIFDHVFLGSEWNPRSKQRHNKLWRSHSDSDLSDHHEPMGKSGMEVSKKEITTSADQISESKTSCSHHHHVPMSPGPMCAGPPTEPLCHLGADAAGNLCSIERVVQLEITTRDFNTEQMEDKLNLNNINGCSSGCCLDDSKFPLDNCNASDALLQQREALGPAAEFPDLAVDDLEKDALKQGDGNIHLVPMEELESCLQDVSNHNSPSPPPVTSLPEEADFGADRIDFFSALEKFVELSQDSRPRTCSHSRTEDQGGGRNGLSKVSGGLELSPSNPTEDAQGSNSSDNSPQPSEGSSVEEERLKLSEPSRSGGLTRSHSENAISVKDIITEIESIRQGAGQGQAKTDALNNPVLVSKRNTVHELPAESAWESKPRKAEPGEGGGSVPKEAASEPLKPDREAASAQPVPSCKLDVEDGGNSGEDSAEGHPNPGPKWCPGSVRRATLEFEERLRQEQELLHSTPVVLLPIRKNSRIESPAVADPTAKGKHEEPSHEQAQSSGEKVASRAGGAETEASLNQPPEMPPASSPPRDGLLAELEGLAREHRLVVSLESPDSLPAPGLLLPKRIEIIEYTQAVKLPSPTGLGRGHTQDESEETKMATTSLAVDENCNAALCSQNPPGPSEPESKDFKKAIFTLGSPGEDAVRGPADMRTSPPASRARCPPPPPSNRQPFVCLQGVTQDSTGTDPQPAPLGGYAGNGQFAFEERGGALRRRSEGALTHWSPEDYDPHPRKVGAGANTVGAAAAPLLRCGLPHSSSSDSIRELRGDTVRQWAKDLEARVWQAGLTLPSLMKRSASLAKLGGLNLSKDDLPSGNPFPSSARPAAPESLQAPSGHGEALSLGGLALPTPEPAPSLPAPQPTAHFVEQLKMAAESIALSSPVERPLAQYAKEFSLARQLPGAKLTSPPEAPLPGLLATPHPPHWLAVLPRPQQGRTRPPRRLRKANDRKRTTNPLYNTM